MTRRANVLAGEGSDDWEHPERETSPTSGRSTHVKLVEKYGQIPNGIVLCWEGSAKVNCISWATVRTTAGAELKGVM